ncbi:MAG: alpha/beta fold hydrolase, partial [Acidimicrobiia bacterium]
ADLLMPLVFNSYARTAATKVGSFLNRFGLVSAHVEEMWHAYRALTEVENRHAFVRTLKAVVDPGGQSVSAKDRLYLTEAMPSLIIWGDEDPIIPVKHGYEAHLAMPGSRLEILKGAGHFPQVEAPEEFTRVLLDFLDTTDHKRAALSDYRQLLVAGEQRKPRAVK